MYVYMYLFLICICDCKLHFRVLKQYCNTIQITPITTCLIIRSVWVFACMFGPLFFWLLLSFLLFMTRGYTVKQTFLHMGESLNTWNTCDYIVPLGIEFKYKQFVFFDWVTGFPFHNYINYVIEVINSILQECIYCSLFVIICRQRFLKRCYDFQIIMVGALCNK